MTATAELIPPEPSTTTAKIWCSACGVSADAGCNCGAPYIPAGQRAAEALAKNPEKSDRAIADEIGVSDWTVRDARKKAIARCLAVEERRIGKDGKQRRLPAQKKSKAIEFYRLNAAERDRLDDEATEIVVRLRQEMPDNQDVMALCAYAEWYIDGSPVEARLWLRATEMAKEAESRQITATDSGKAASKPKPKAALPAPGSGLV